MDTTHPLITVITAAHDAGQYLSPLIHSVLTQDYPYYEHIIIDDGSDDDGATTRVLALYPHLHWWSRDNQGQYATQNEAIARAQGSIIVVISADDLFVVPDAFSRVVGYWRTHPTVDMVYGKTARVDQHGKPLPNVDLTRSPSRWLLRHLSYVQHCSLFVSRELAQVTPFDSSFNCAGDWDWVNRLFDSASEIGYIPEPLSLIRVHPSQTSRRSAPESIADEHRRVCTSYGGSYSLHILIQRLNSYRAMALLAWHTLRHQGSRALFYRLKEWRCSRSRRP